MRKKLEREARTGATIVAYKYPVVGWTLRDVHRTVDERDTPKLYLKELEW